MAVLRGKASARLTGRARVHRQEKISEHPIAREQTNLPLGDKAPATVKEAVQEGLSERQAAKVIM